MIGRKLHEVHIWISMVLLPVQKIQWNINAVNYFFFNNSKFVIYLIISPLLFLAARRSIFLSRRECTIGKFPVFFIIIPDFYFTLIIQIMYIWIWESMLFAWENDSHCNEISPIASQFPGKVFAYCQIPNENLTPCNMSINYELMKMTQLKRS